MRLLKVILYKLYYIQLNIISYFKIPRIINFQKTSIDAKKTKSNYYNQIRLIYNIYNTKKTILNRPLGLKMAIA